MKHAIVAGALALLVVAPQAYAADRRVEIPFADLVHSPEAKDAGIDGSVRFYLAGQKTPYIAQRLGEGISRKKTNAVGKSDEASCHRAMLSVLKSFQNSAKGRGANAIVNMVSYFKNNEEKNPTSYSCYIGGFMTSVTMKGTYAKIR